MPIKDVNKRREYQRQWTAARRMSFFSINDKCIQCGSFENLELDHIDPEQKVNHRIWSWSDNRRKEELKKCQVLCKICHRNKSNQENVKRFTGTPKLSLRVYSEEQIFNLLTYHLKDGMSQRDAAAKAGVSRSILSEILYRNAWPEIYRKFPGYHNGNGPAC